MYKFKITIEAPTGSGKEAVKQAILKTLNEQFNAEYLSHKDSYDFEKPAESFVVEMNPRGKKQCKCLV